MRHETVLLAAEETRTNSVTAGLTTTFSRPLTYSLVTVRPIERMASSRSCRSASCVW